MTLPAAIGRWLGRLPGSVFLVLVALLAVVENGVWVRPGVEFIQQMSADPWHNVLPDQPLKHYLYTSYLGLVLAYLTGAWRSVGWFAALHLAEFGLLFALGLRWVRQSYGASCTRLVAALFLCSPVSLVLLTWLGIGDVLVFGFATLLVLSRRPPATFVLALLLGLSHVEQAAVIIGTLAVGGLVFRLETLGPTHEARTHWCLAAILGVALAYGLLQGLFAWHHFDLREDRISYFLRRGSGEFVQRFTRHLAVTIYSLLLAAWPLVAWIVATLWRRRRATVGWLAFALGAGSAIAVSVFDVTRVFALITWPFLFVALLETRRSGEGESNDEGWLGIAMIASLVFPRIYAWSGDLHGSAWAADWHLLLQLCAPGKA